MKRVVDEQLLAFAATVNPDGTPNLSPKGTIAVLDDDHLMFADLASPQTIENLRRNAGIELNVVESRHSKGISVQGTRHRSCRGRTVRPAPCVVRDRRSRDRTTDARGEDQPE
jgi:predicted pyridoxine 5'-phosphate oxidase superfamily flavin-nucleotide-binding protein